MHKQLELFQVEKSILPPRKPKLTMNQETLLSWKEKVFRHQEEVRNALVPEQPSLFEMTSQSFWQAEEIDPFSLKRYTYYFFDLPDNWCDPLCIYFIIDHAMPIILYVGETKQTPKQRWQQHDCRDYVRNYIHLHREYNLEVTVSSAFIFGVPEDNKARKKLETELILRWRSPFNKEMYKFYGKPFSN